MITIGKPHKRRNKKDKKLYFRKIKRHFKLVIYLHEIISIHCIFPNTCLVNYSIFLLDRITSVELYVIPYLTLHNYFSAAELSGK